MTQITGALSAVAAEVQYSANGSSWSSFGSTYSKVSPGDSARMSGEAYTFDGDTPIVTYGKLEPIEVTFTLIYTEGASDEYKTLEDFHVAAAGTAIYLRWIPKGLTAGNFAFSTGSCKITNWKRPEVDAASGDPLICEFTVKTASITRSAYAT